MEIIVITLLVTTFASLFALLLKVCFASKCQDIKICYGLIEIKRDTAHEMQTISRDTHDQISNIENTPQNI